MSLKVYGREPKSYAKSTIGATGVRQNIDWSRLSMEWGHGANHKSGFRERHASKAASPLTFNLNLSPKVALPYRAYELFEI